MVFVGYHASHEQLAPRALLESVIAAERAGFDGGFSADHFAPWTSRQGQSGNTMAWLGAALASTRLPFGAIATPGQRYHPAVMAHAMATYAEMFPGRYFAALGSGELLNEHITGDPWPSKDERTARLGECVDVIRRLLRGEEVTHEGRVVVDRAKLWSLPEVVPPMFATATSEPTARWAADWADGLLTVGTQADDLGAVVSAYRDAGGRGETAVQVHVALGNSDEHAMGIVRDQWIHGVVTPPEAWDIALPEEFEQRAGDPTDDALREHVLTASDVGELADDISELVAVGFDRVYVHDISTDQLGFLTRSAPELLRRLRATNGETS